MELVIFGAQGYALGAYEAIKELYPAQKIRCFLVSGKGQDPYALEGIPVERLSVFSQGITQQEKDRLKILIATPENIHEEIEELLKEHGFHHRQRLTSAYWGELMAPFHNRKGRFLPLATLSAGGCAPLLRVYAARSHMDRPLKNSYDLPPYMSYIQAGAANCDGRIAALADDTGDSISEKNRKYAELTALYWLWKNVLEDVDGQGGSADGRDKIAGLEEYFGFVQYRRMIQLNDEDLLRFVDNEVDVVLPYPMPYEPDINAHHERYVKERDFSGLLQAISEVAPEYAEAFPDILAGRYMYNYNVIIAKKAVLRDYCRWLFPIFRRAEEICEADGRERDYKYLGYLGETMETLYFMYHAKDLNIVHAECRMLV